MHSEGYGTWSVCLYMFILELQATRQLMSNTNGFSAKRARKIMWQISDFEIEKLALSSSMLRGPTHQTAAHMLYKRCRRAHTPSAPALLRNYAQSDPGIRTLASAQRTLEDKCTVQCCSKRYLLMPPA